MASSDPFDRQRCISGWRQDILEKQVCLVLGVGGLGCTIAMTLCRLGVMKVILIDYDRVEAHNLNRQLLFSVKHVGMRKVDAAADGLSAHIIGKHTTVETHHIDVTHQWQLVVKLARESTVIFNNIDIGGYFDYATLSLAQSLKVPYSAGSSYARTWIVEYYRGHTTSSFSLDYPDGDESVLRRLGATVIQDQEDLHFLPHDANPPTRSIGSSVLVCGTAGIMTVNAWAQQLMEIAEMPNFTKFDVAAYWESDGVVAWPPPPPPPSSSSQSQ